MRIHLVALAMMTLFSNVGVAHASERSSDGRFASSGQAVCTTTFKGDSFVGQAPTKESAEQAAMAACLKHGGNLNDCRANMICKIDDGGYPVPAPNPNPTPEPKPEPDQDQDQDGDQNQGGQTDQDDQNDGEGQQHKKAYYDWGRGVSGYGYCYQFTASGHIMNNGYPQPNMSCERTRPSHFNWGRSWNGYVYCYQWTPYMLIMNDGRPVAPGYCHY